MWRPHLLSREHLSSCSRPRLEAVGFITPCGERRSSVSCDVVNLQDVGPSPSTAEKGRLRVRAFALLWKGPSAWPPRWRGGRPWGVAFRNDPATDLAHCPRGNHLPLL